ncbi:UTRA domain-containing protein [Streptomyces sp. NPDC014870]|uniref:UTRA domain-containing protein n=1 Tax=Streptomyces sp. NPDC014870 TaxID=3364925 RepID=UPI0036F683D1
MLTGAGHAPVRADYTARADLAAPEEATLLDLAPPAPVLRATRVSYDAADIPCAKSHETYRTDRYELRLSLT